MNIVLAPDSFKGSLTSPEATSIMKKAIINLNSKHNVIEKPMADGGEGTLDALLSSTNGKKVSLNCTGATGKNIYATYAIIESNTAVIELAEIVGLEQVPYCERDPDHTTTFGVGEVILDALDKGCNSFIFGLGGSATNDGGLGMLVALGMEAWDRKKNKIDVFGKDLHKVEQISFKNLDKRLKKAKLKVACDVDSPLCGEKGASKVFGPQKGASKEQIKYYDRALNQFGDIVEAAMNESIKEVPGAGAAGGTGFALLALGAELVSGAELLAKVINVEKEILKADLVITGEGQSDTQTLYGKAPGYIASLANKNEVPILLLSGSIAGESSLLREHFTGCFSIINAPITTERCMKEADNLLYVQTQQVIYFINSYGTVNNFV